MAWKYHSIFINLLRSRLTNRTQMCLVNGVFSGTKTELDVKFLRFNSVSIPFLYQFKRFTGLQVFVSKNVCWRILHQYPSISINIHQWPSIMTLDIKQWFFTNKFCINLVKTEYLLILLGHDINKLFPSPKIWSCYTNFESSLFISSEILCFYDFWTLEKGERSKSAVSFTCVLMNFIVGKSTLKKSQKSPNQNLGGQKTRTSYWPQKLNTSLQCTILSHFDYY